MSPDEAVAMGAAIQGGVLSGEVDDLVLLDVTPLSLGVAVQGGLFEPIIGRNTTIPTVESKPFTTAEDNQCQVQINVFQGEREIAQENEFLGNFTLSGIPPAQAGAPQIDIRFRIDEDGIVHVEAEDEGSGEKEGLVLEGGLGLSDEKVEEMRQEAEQHAEEDKLRRQRVEAQNEARDAIARAESLLEKYDDVSPGLRNRIQGQIDSLEQTLEQEGALIEDFESQTERLTSLLKQLGKSESDNIDPDSVSTEETAENTDNGPMAEPVDIHSDDDETQDGSSDSTPVTGDLPKGGGESDQGDASVPDSSEPQSQDDAPAVDKEPEASEDDEDGSLDDLLPG